MRCAQCGKPGTKFVEGLCSDCHLVNNPQPFTYKELSLEECKQCKKLRVRGEWRSYPHRDNKIISLLVDAVHPNIGTKIKITALHEKVAILRVGVKGTKNFIEYSLPYRVINTLCMECQKQRTAYFTAIVQVRNESPQVSQFITLLMAKNKRATIAKTDPVGSDHDYYLSSNQAALVLAKKIVSHFGGTYKTYEKLFSKDWQTSKDLYRVSILITLPKEAKGDIVGYGEDVYKIREIKKHIHLQSLTTHKKKAVTQKETLERLAVMEAKIAKIKPSVAVIDPVTFQLTSVENPRPFSLDTSVNIVRWHNKVWLV